MSSSVLSSTTLSTLMKDISEALQLDRNDHYQEAYKKYVECVLKIASKLLLNVRDEGGQVTVTKEVTKFTKLGQQCMERVVLLVQEKLDNPNAIKPGTNLHLAQEKVGSGPGQQKHINSLVDRVVSPDSSQLLRTGVEHRERIKKMSPMELALYQNQQLMNAFRARQAQSRNKSAYANLSLTLQRKMVENLSLAKVQEESLAKKMKARQERLEEQATKRFNTPVGMSEAEQEQRQVYKKIIEFEQEEIWLLDWRKRLEEDPTDSVIVSKLIQEILRCEDHPLTQQLKIYQKKIFSKLLPIAEHADAIKQVKVPLPDDIYVRILKPEYNQWKSSASKESTQKTTKYQSANSHKCMKHSDELSNQSSEVYDVSIEQPSCTQADESNIPTQTNLASNDQFDLVAKIQTKEMMDIEVDIDNSSDGKNLDNNPSGAVSSVGDKVCGQKDEKKDYSEIYSEVQDDVEKAVYRGEMLSSKLEKENFDVKILVRQVTEEYEKYSMENMDDLFENDEDDDEYLNDNKNKDTEVYPDSWEKNEVSKSEVTERKALKTSNNGMSDKLNSKPANIYSLNKNCYENLENKIKALINEAYHRHLKGITEDVLTYIEKLQVLFIVAYEELESPMGRDQCNMLIEDAFFMPLWTQLLSLLRLAYEPKEIALAHVMTKKLNSVPRDFGVRGKLCLMREGGHDVGSYPYEDAVMELRNIADCHTMLSKLECLVKTSRLVCQCVQEFYKDTKQSPEIGADDLLPVLCYIVCRSQLPQIVSECHAIENFVHEGYLLGEEGYCLTSIQTATSFLVKLGMERD
ncbi:hypothetical protein CHS0354_008632 [Potamilus streckersoni]|uniref:VPS9 domain-containing protein n=1 Tax=Potamilus streckersoni TaxID=2493646 RepID=A0AAE0TIQ3_9BIVA|nr:hypothetical protein CHS0354_008632 [Potamilus streckersoni]